MSQCPLNGLSSLRDVLLELSKLLVLVMGMLIVLVTVVLVVAVVLGSSSALASSCVVVTPVLVLMVAPSPVVVLSVVILSRVVIHVTPLRVAAVLVGHIALLKQQSVFGSQLQNRIPDVPLTTSRLNFQYQD